jgi:hypothetical protein
MVVHVLRIIVDIDGQYYHLSHPGSRPVLKERAVLSVTFGPDDPPIIRNVFGTDTEVLGAVVQKIGLFEFHKGNRGFHQIEAHPSIALDGITHVAVLANEETHAIVLPDRAERRPAGPGPQVLRFRHCSDLFEWYRSGPNGSVRPAHAAPLPSPPAADVHAGAGACVARLADGSAATWGAPHHGRLLGRRVDRDAPARVPGALDLPLVAVERAALRGGLGAAVTSNGGAYVWGEVLGPPLVGGFSLSKLVHDEEQVLKLVVIEEGGEQLDVVDMDVGVSHLVCLTASGQVWVAGTNEHGQLGHPGDAAKAEWTRLGDFVARKVVCGPQSTFFICRDDDDLGGARTVLFDAREEPTGSYGLH